MKNQIRANANNFIGTREGLAYSQKHVQPLNGELSGFRSEFASMKAEKYKFERKEVVAQGAAISLRTDPHAAQYLVKGHDNMRTLSVAKNESLQAEYKSSFSPQCKVAGPD